MFTRILKFKSAKRKTQSALRLVAALSFGLLLCVLSFTFCAIAASAAEKQNPVILYFFYGQGCPHCAKEEKFLEKLQTEFPDLKIEKFELWYNQDNQKLLQKIVEKLKIRGNSVPITIIDGKAIYGYADDETTGKTIKETVAAVRANPASDPLKEIISGGKENSAGASEKMVEEKGAPTSDLPLNNKIPEKIKVPFFGEIKIKILSLPALSVILGAIDGFNPCAMWVLVFLISLLLKMQNTRRRLVLGLAFIAASALVYFLFMTAWLNFFLFVGYVFWLRLVIALVALGSGIYQIHEFFVNKDAACKVTKGQKQRKTFDKLKDIVSRKSFLLALGGICLLALAVNLVELFCSIGLPAVFTNVLTMSNIPRYRYYLYIFLYLFFFMLDDMIVFIVAMSSLKILGFDKKYSRYSGLIGGIIILIVGILLILKPEWLMFG